MADPMSQVVIALTITFGGALLIERIIEAFKHIIEHTDQEETLPAAQTLRRLKASVSILSKALLAFEKAETETENAKAYADALRVGLDDATKHKSTHPTARHVDEGDTVSDAFEHYSPVTVKTIPAYTEIEIAQRKQRLFYHITALGLGIIYASALEIHLLYLVFQSSFALPNETALSPWSEFLDECISGLIIAGGSQPIHVLIRFVSTRKLPASDTVLPEDDSEEAKPTKRPETSLQTAPVLSLSPTDRVQTMNADVPGSPTQQPDQTRWQEIVYRGGVKPASLEHRNKRRGNPTAIVFHHTAMSSELGFQAIVDEFLVNKGWSTGYHCVIMPNGAIRPFCRWDRVGNHTKGHNNRTLGVAFHGNFHTDANDAYSNHDGRFGIQEPTPAQLESGARLIALWVNLYDDITLDDVQAHREVKPGYTVCPGSNFPLSELKARVAEFTNEWHSSTIAQSRLSEFRSQPYLYV